MAALTAMYIRAHSMEMVIEFARIRLRSAC